MTTNESTDRRPEPGATERGRTSPGLGTVITLAVVTTLVAGTLVARRRGYAGLGANTIVRCRQGHLFTTIWIPGASVKAVRLGWYRLQRCPVGKHWSLVKPVKDRDLSDEERRTAQETHDVRIP